MSVNAMVEARSQSNIENIQRVLRVLFTPGDVVEIRILGTRYQTVSGYFNDMDALSRQAIEWNGQASIYVTLNRVDPSLLARSANRLRQYAKDTTSDTHIVRRRWLPIDIDPVRASGISSTGAEHDYAIETGEKIARFLLDCEIPKDSIVLADSGNGGHVLVRIDLPNDEESSKLVQRCLEAVALRFSDDRVSVDLTVHNPARIWKLYGTKACKGSDIPQRPHRTAKIRWTSKHGISIAPRPALEKLASLAPEPPKVETFGAHRDSGLNLDDWISKYAPDVIGPFPWKDGRKWLFPVCPWEPEHTGRSAFILQFPNRAIDAGCLGNRCVGKDWQALRDIREPGWRTKRSDNFRPQQEQARTDNSQEKTPDHNPWARIKDAPTFIAEEDKAITGVAKDLIMPGAVTAIAAPRGLCKTLIIHGVAYAMATGGVFRGERVEPIRVLLVDRDNPERVVKDRLRSWGAATAPNFHLLTRTDAPDLKDKRAWEKFPVDKYDVVIIDSIGSFTEGITEKEGKETTQVLATVLNLIHRGPAVVLLANCTKDALSVKGRGEWSDRVDIIYEGRDATGFTPSGKKPWFQELPAAGEDAWADRSARRKNRTDYRLAFIPSKFRLGAEPEPFCLEVNVPKDETWTLTDVTADIIKGSDDAIEAVRAKEERRMEDAAKVLAGLVKDRFDAKDPILKTDAENLLHDEGVTRVQARTILETKNGTLWQYPNEGHPKPLSPVLQTSPDGNGKTWVNPLPERLGGGIDLADHAQRGRQGHPPSKPASGLAVTGTTLLPPKGVISRDEGQDGGQKEASFSAETEDEEEAPRYREERAGIQDDDGFEEIPK